MNWLAFTNPLMLGGLAAVGLPVLIHFLTRARPQRIAFPPYKFLMEACAGQQAVHRLRTIILLTIRTLAVLALVLLFAKPFLKPAAAVNTDAAKRVVLVVDASLSMRAVQGGVSLFAHAQAEAADVLRGLDSGTEAAVILEGATPKPLLPALSRNLPALHDELVKAQPTFEAGDVPAALALAKKILGGSGTIFVFSDFQKSDWEKVDRLPAGVICRLRQVTTSAIDNVAITGARLMPAEPVAGEPAQAVCTVFNCTPRPREESVRLEFSDFAQETRVALPPFGSADAVFNLTFSHTGSFAGKASIQPDDLLEDNTRYLSVRVNKALQILVVSDSDDHDERSAAFYVSRALSPSAQATPGLNIVRRRSQDTDRGILETADIFVPVAPVMLSGEAAEIITRRVQDGARLISFLDGPTSPMLMFPGLNPPFQLQQNITSAAGDPVRIGRSKPFAELDAGDFSSFRFHRHFQNVVFTNRQSDVLLSYPDGSAALTLNQTSNGATAFVNLPLTPDDPDFIGSPIFPATLHEILGALRRGSGDRPVFPGEAWMLDVPTAGEGAVSISDPRGHAMVAQVVASGRMTRLALPPAHEPGDYVIKQADNLIAHAVVNVDPRESDTRPIALADLKSGEGSSVSVVQQDDLAISNQNRRLWPELAAAAVVLLALEMLLLAFWRRPASLLRGGVEMVASTSSRMRIVPAASMVEQKETEVVR
jgi:hypothetical protein